MALVLAKRRRIASVEVVPARIAVAYLIIWSYCSAIRSHLMARPTIAGTSRVTAAHVPQVVLGMPVLAAAGDRAHPRVPPPDEPGGRAPHPAEGGAWRPASKPCELAQAFARLAVPVSIVEAIDRLLPGVEPEASGLLATVLAADGITVHTGAQVKIIGSKGGRVVLHTGAGPEVSAQRLLVAVGPPRHHESGVGRGRGAHR
jgi:hypothetical protein